MQGLTIGHVFLGQLPYDALFQSLADYHAQQGLTANPQTVNAWRNTRALDDQTFLNMMQWVQQNQAQEPAPTNSSSPGSIVPKIGGLIGQAIGKGWMGGTWLDEAELGGSRTSGEKVGRGWMDNTWLGQGGAGLLARWMDTPKDLR
jgi:hypothetical protein